MGITFKKSRRPEGRRDFSNNSREKFRE